MVASQPQSAAHGAVTRRCNACLMDGNYRFAVASTMKWNEKQKDDEFRTSVKSRRLEHACTKKTLCILNRTRSEHRSVRLHFWVLCKRSMHYSSWEQTMCDAVLDQFPIRISVDYMMDSCLVSKWLRFNSTREAHIHTCSWHRERERGRERSQMRQTSKH